MPSPFLYVMVWFRVIDTHEPCILLRKMSTLLSLPPKLPYPATRRQLGLHFCLHLGLLHPCHHCQAKLKVIECGKLVDEAALDIVTSHIPKLLTKPQASSHGS
ncbi:hypothetical protein HKD37_15G043336 [Glycine soja]